ncbi:MAG: hypothetical protein U7127_03060 [Phormidium sp.]
MANRLHGCEAARLVRNDSRDYVRRYAEWVLADQHQPVRVDDQNTRMRSQLITVSVERELLRSLWFWRNRSDRIQLTVNN